MIKSGKGYAFLSGNEAFAQGAYEAGLKVACAYPGTPSTEILEYLSLFDEVDSQWSVNEKVAYEVSLSASIGGVRSLYSSKHVGINVAMDPLMTSAYTGVGAGFVVVSADDPGLHSSQNEQDNRLIARIAQIPLIEPSSPAEAYEFSKLAFKISERFDTPVMFRMTTRISHTKENLKTGERVDVPAKDFQINIPKYVMIPKNAHQRHIDLQSRLEKLKKFSENTPINKIYLDDKKMGFITSSVSYQYVKEMYPNASILKLGMSYPFPEAKVKEFAKKVNALYVVEELEPFIEEQVKILGIKVKGKHKSFSIGELKPEDIPSIVKGKERIEGREATRKPVLCPGCSHRAVFNILRKLKVIVAGDIGCYTLGALPPLSALHTCVCMGAGVTFFEGLRKAISKDRNIAGVIGDSTFVHSGITGLINLAYNGAKGLIFILDNGTTAMTGNQPHPATGKTIKGGDTTRLNLESICRAAGVDTVDVIDPHEQKDLEELVKSRLAGDSLSVIIARYPCRLLIRTKEPVPVHKQDKCKKCYRCISIDCPAIYKTDEGLVEINNSVCVGCNLCVTMCKFGGLNKNEG